jgi:hypothetical protein
MQAKPGEPLASTRALRKRKQWPPTRIQRMHGDVPPAMPYLVVAADANDDGSRPIDPERAVHSAAIEVLDAAGAAVAFPAPGTAYTLRATVTNRGPVASYAGVAEFFVNNETLGVEGFLAPAGGAVTVTCRRSWTPADVAAAAGSVVVCAYDALLDRPEKRFAPTEDRHVGRRDLLADFAGVWNGLSFFANAPGGAGNLYRVEVKQAGVDVDVSIYEQVSEVAAHGGPVLGGAQVPGGGPVLQGGPRGPQQRGPRGPVPGGPLPGGPVPGGILTHVLPAQPQLKGNATIVGNQVQLHMTGFNFTPPVPFTTDDVTLTLTDPETLHVTQHETFVDPNDPRGPIDLVADLKR